MIHDKGISRLSGIRKVQKGKWYFGFICSNCKGNIYSLENTHKLNESPIKGNGKFSVPCFNCNTDEIIYSTSDIKIIKAKKNINFSNALPRKKPSNRPKQPIKTRYSKAKPTFGTSFLEERPECAVIIARCISIWSYIDNDFALLLAAILGINTQPALAMFLAIQNSRTQIDVLNAAAEVSLSESDYELMSAILNIRSAYEKERNSLVHGLYGWSNIVKNGILWMEQKYSVRHTATVWSSDYQDMDQSRITKHTFVYEPEDLETIAINFEWLHQMIGFFRGYISSDNFPWRVERYHQLCAEPRLSKELARMRENQKKSP